MCYISISHQGTNEQAKNAPPDAHIGPCNELVTHSMVYPAFAHMQHPLCSSKMDKAKKKAELNNLNKSNIVLKLQRVHEFFWHLMYLCMYVCSYVFHN